MIGEEHVLNGTSANEADVRYEKSSQILGNSSAGTTKQDGSPDNLSSHHFSDKVDRPSIPGSRPPELSELVRAEDRLSFVYFEHCIINREDNAITVLDNRGTIHLPTASLGVIMLGPGTNITHQAMSVIGENGATVVWVGERGIRMYAFGRPLTHSSGMLQRQAALVSNTRKRLGVARAMYQMRFEHEDVSACTMQQLRGREGARIRQVYRYWSAETGIAWDKRTYDHENFDSGTEINKALSAAHTCLYGIAHSVIVALGCSPGLGFVHVGHERSFVYDIADLYKAEVSIPVAFRTTAMQPDDIGSATRHAMRDAVYDLSLMKRISGDISKLLGSVPSEEISDGEDDHIGLWDDKVGEVPAGHLYI